MTQPAEYSIQNPDRDDLVFEATRAANRVVMLANKLCACVAIASLVGEGHSQSKGNTRHVIEGMRRELDVVLANVEAIENG